jgi:hypothetical protein
MNALLIGCGSKWGGDFFLPEIKKDYKTTLITSSNIEDPDLNIIKISYNDINQSLFDNIKDKIKDIKFDLIFFNHNSGGGPGAEYFSPNGPKINSAAWSSSLYIHCHFPAMLIRELTENITEDTKVGWMLTGMIKDANPDNYQWGLYGSAKYINLCIMRLFSQNHPGIFFGINPWWFPKDEAQQRAEDISGLIKNLTKEHNGKAFTPDGKEWY